MKLRYLLLGGKVQPQVQQNSNGDRQAEKVLKLTATGLDKIVSAGMRHHWDTEMAVHHYPYEYYALWRKELGEKPIFQIVGAFNENFSTVGMNEKNIAIGDVFRLGSALIEVSQGRQPCANTHARFDVPDMSKRMQKSSRTGWYYRVLEEGLVHVGDEFRLAERRAPDWTIDRLTHLYYFDPLNTAELQGAIALEPLAQSWRDVFAKRLKNGRVED